MNQSLQKSSADQELDSTADSKTALEVQKKNYLSRFIGEEIVDLINESTPKKAVLKRKGRAGGEYDYVNTYWMIQRLNVVFGCMWNLVVDSYEFFYENIEVEDAPTEEEKKKPPAIVRGGAQVEKAPRPTHLEKVPTQVFVKGYIEVTIPKRKMTNKDGTIEIDEVRLRKSSFGGSDVKVFAKGENAGMAMDVGDDLKAATSDLLKKCASMFGICSDLYGKRETNENSGITPSHISNLVSTGGYLDEKRERTIIIEKLNKLAKERFDVDKVEQLTLEQYLEFIKQLRADQFKGAGAKIVSKPKL